MGIDDTGYAQCAGDFRDVREADKIIACSRPPVEDKPVSWDNMYYVHTSKASPNPYTRMKGKRRLKRNGKPQ